MLEKIVHRVITWKISNKNSTYKKLGLCDKEAELTWDWNLSLDNTARLHSAVLHDLGVSGWQTFKLNSVYTFPPVPIALCLVIIVEQAELIPAVPSLWGGSSLFFAKSQAQGFLNDMLCRVMWDLAKEKYMCTHTCMLTSTWNGRTAGTCFSHVVMSGRLMWFSMSKFC